MKKFLSSLKDYLIKVNTVVFLRKIINSYRFPANIMGLIQGRKRRYVKDAKKWEKEGVYKSDFYKALDQPASKFVDYVNTQIERNDSVLDICCNQGRFLFELKKRGVEHLYGFDIMEEAIDKFKHNEGYDSDKMHVEHVLAQDYFKNKDDGIFDWAITYTATIELIHPGFDIFSELGRTVKKGMFLVLNENGHSYPRFYRMLHKKNGFKILSVIPWMDDAVLIHSVKL